MKLKIVMLMMKIVAFFEKLFLAKERVVRADYGDELKTLGYSYGSDTLIDIAIFEIQEEVSLPNYSIKKILTRESINKFANDILANNEVRDRLSTFFNGPFSIDFITYYKTLPLPEQVSGGSFYANHWHFDTLLSENCVKILMLPISLSDGEGPFQAYSRDDTVRLFKSGFTRGETIPAQILDGAEPTTFTGDRSRVLFARPHVCFHAAGVPSANKHREQIMIQLNPARQWGYRTDLFEMQYEREPTLAFIKNLFRPKTVCDFS